MTLPATLWRGLLPISHYIEIQFGQVNYGAPLQAAMEPLQHLALFVVPLLFVCYKARRLGARHMASGVKQ